MIEPEDVAIAEEIVNRFVRFAESDCRRQIMQGKIEKDTAWHTFQLIALQRGHLCRVRWNAGVLINNVLWRKRDKSGKSFLPWDAAMENRARKIDFALILHDLCKLNPREPGGINVERHANESMHGVLQIASDILHKEEAFARALMDLSELAFSPYALRGKNGAQGKPMTMDEAVVLAANTLEYVDFYGSRFIVWIRQHPQVQHALNAPEACEESIGGSIAFAQKMCERSCNALWYMKVPGIPEDALKPISGMAYCYEKRSRRFFEHFAAWAPKTFLDFRKGFGVFYRGMLRKCIPTPKWNLWEKED